MYSDRFIECNRKMYFQDVIMQTSLGGKYHKIVSQSMSRV